LAGSAIAIAVKLIPGPRQAGPAPLGFVDKWVDQGQNTGMKTPEKLVTAADAEAVIEHAITGKPLDPDVARRVREQSERATEELRRSYVTVNVAVGLIRETREDE
jgi:predicted house-cleaning NTP pyrophosphatase (Maf/HAM1 superfamily)